MALVLNVKRQKQNPEAPKEGVLIQDKKSGEIIRLFVNKVRDHQTVSLGFEADIARYRIIRENIKDSPTTPSPGG